ncbi:MAG: hypothetical protein EZS28_003226 [Streblomastix strix]|uniref:Uncharacterized protein n=1 Tax=Streblomastix strix TaxID=222440 RepID=A0A5J4X206_9EUKA|nr:MAG: hypothetical protein EZS28_003226 [Streblomastix strix]
MKLQDEGLLKRKGQHGGGVIDACSHANRHAVVALLVTPHLAFDPYPVKFERNASIMQFFIKFVSVIQLEIESREALNIEKKSEQSQESIKATITAKCDKSVWFSMTQKNWCDIVRAGFKSQVEILLPQSSISEKVKIQARVEELWGGTLIYEEYKSFHKERVAFWRQFPIKTNDLKELELIIIKYLSCSCSEAPCERFFSLMKRDLGPQRNSLSDINLLAELQMQYRKLQLQKEAQQ